MSGLRIAQVCADRGIRAGGTKGAAQHLRGIANGLAVLGHEVTLYAAAPADGPFPVPVRPLGDLGSDATADVVYERLSLGHRGGLQRARDLGVPFVLEVNAPLVDEARTHRAGSVRSSDAQLERELIAEADLVVSVSTDLTNWILERRIGPVLTQPNGFEPSWFDDLHPAARADDVEFPVVFLGHPKPWHGADRIVPMLVALRAIGRRPRMLVVGGGPGADALRADADRAGIGDQLVVTGSLPPAEATRRLGDAVIGLAPYPPQSPFYFCPLKIVDYLAAGLAVVSTRQGDIGRIIGDAGVLLDATDLADPADGSALAAAVDSLLGDDDGRRELGRAGRDRAHRTMTWDAVAARTAGAIDDVLGAIATSGVTR